MKARVHKISESWKMHWVREDVPVRCTLCGCYCPVVAWFMVKLRGLASIICWEPPGSVVQAWCCNSMTKLWTASNTWISPKNKKYALMDWTETETTCWNCILKCFYFLRTRYVTTSYVELKYVIIFYVLMIIRHHVMAKWQRFSESPGSWEHSQDQGGEYH